ncbi:MAG: radical SAM family heme chaperone HemW [Rhodopirellula sp.]|nr:radical SAM family heme chaperone HemW [Rhodopirellula sp.]
MISRHVSRFQTAFPVPISEKPDSAITGPPGATSLWKLFATSFSGGRVEFYCGSASKSYRTLRHVNQPRSLYIHVPFCAHRCGYCDFTLVAGKDHLAEKYLDALSLEIDRELQIHGDAELATQPKPEIDTVFFGGGTPTQLSAAQLKRLYAIVHDRFQLTSETEFSVEANPARMTDEKIAVLADAGVNRISLGVQSFDDATLTMLERDHRRADVFGCVDRVKVRIANVSLDLIFAVPGQTLALWESTLQTAIDLSPTHLSTYGLTFEKGTAFWTRREKGELPQASDDLERQMYEVAMEKLAAADFHQYEISSFARPGFRCRHNQVYWSGQTYFGFGPGAASLMNNERRQNHRSVTTWLKKVLAGESAIGDVEKLDPESRARELLVLGLRTNDGVERAWFQETSGYGLNDLAGETINRLIEKGLLEETGSTIRLSHEGRFLADTVAGELL